MDFIKDIKTFLDKSGLLNEPDLRKELVEQVVKYCKNSNEEFTLEFKHAIEKINIDGFRPGKVPLPKIVQKLSSINNLHSQAINLIFFTWSNMLIDLKESCRKFLIDIDEDIVTVRDGLTRSDEDCFIEKYTKIYMEKHPDSNEKLVKIMLCYLIMTAIPKNYYNEDEQDSKKENKGAVLETQKFTNFWQDCLDKLIKLPFNSKEWMQSEQFIETIRRLKSEKEKESVDNEKQKKISESINYIFQIYNNYLEMLGMTECRNWLESEPKVTYLDQIIDLLHGFNQNLKMYVKKEERTYKRPKNPEENRLRRQLLDELDEIEPELESQYKQLSKYFSMDLSENTNSQIAIDQGKKHLYPYEQANKSTEVINEKEQGIIDEQAKKDKKPVKESDEHLEAEDTFAEDESEKQKNEILHCNKEKKEEEFELKEPVSKHPPSVRDKGKTSESTRYTKSAKPEHAFKNKRISVTIGKSKIYEELESQNNYLDSTNLNEKNKRETRTIVDSDTTPSVIERERDLLFLEIAERDDLTAGYWLSLSYENEHVEAPIPSWMYEALTGSRLIDWDSDSLVDNLLEITYKHSPTNDEELKIAGLAAALKPALISPGTGMTSWLNPLRILPQIQPLVNVVQDFTSRQYPLKAQDLIGIESREERDIAIQTLIAEVQRFVEDASSREIKYGVATKVWRSFIGQKGEIRQLLEPVVNDNRDQINFVADKLKNWRSKEFIESRIKTTQRNWMMASREIFGSPKRHLLDFIRQATTYALNWVNLIERENQIRSQGGWLTDQVLILKEIVQQISPDILPALQDLHSEGNSMTVRIGAWYLGRSLIQFSKMLNIEIDEYWGNKYNLKMKDYLLGNGRLLSEVIRERLVWFPDLVFSENFSDKDIDSDTISNLIRNAYTDNHTLVDAADKWIDKQDYRFVEQIISHLSTTSTDSSVLDQLYKRYQDNIEGSRETLTVAIDRAVEKIEQALVDGIILEEHRSEMIGYVEEINPEEEKQISMTIKRIEHIIDKEIEDRRNQRLEYLRERWNEITLKISQVSSEKGIIKNITDFVENRISMHDTRNIEECLAHLQEVLEGSVEINLKLFESNTDDPCAQLNDFTKKITNIEQWLENNQGLSGVHRQIESKRGIHELSYRGLLADRIESSRNAVVSFIRLKKKRIPEDRQPELVRELLQFLGYRSNHGDVIHIEIRTRNNDILHVSAAVKAGNLARPIPEFGSRIIGGLNVVVLWGRPVAETIASLIQELRIDKQSVIIFYLGRLTQPQRRDILRLSRVGRLTTAILDETLLTYLTFERGERLKSFLCCALPFTNIIPYKPFEAGDIPPEVFYGRNKDAKELRPDGGTCLVYGGRQLGKSALLREAQRTYHNPDFGHYAWVEDIRDVGDPTNQNATQFKSEIWERIRDELNTFGLFKNDVRSNDPKRLKPYIIDLMKKHERRILVMFDEADHFLQADATEDFPVIQELKTLMAKTDRRFKVVFAGLHAVQRFQGIRNQPLAHFGTPIQIGPLAPHDAVMLVKEPMATIGFEMDDSTVLRILSYTNYHAGLIQFFCKKLIEKLTSNKNYLNTMPPYNIKRVDVEAVYMDPAVRDEIRQRLELTLRLDRRYEAIAWTLIVEQQGDRDSYAKAFAATEVLKLVREYWPQGFLKVETDSMRSSLDEMCGLGVLVKNSDGYYRLRSPNVVRLMGTETDIEARLLELSNKEPEEEFKPDSHHSPLDRHFSHYSPLTYSQERDITPPSFGVSILFSSSALGNDTLLNSLKTLVPKELVENNKGCVEIVSGDHPISINTLYEYFTGLVGRNPKFEQIISVLTPQCNINELKDAIKTAIDFCNRKKSRIKKRWMKIIFVLNPNMVANWISIDELERQKLENLCDAVLSPRLWNKVAIRNRLKQLNKLFSPEVCETVYVATGGWPFLLDYLFDTFQDVDNLMAPANQLKDDLTNRESNIYINFRKAISIGKFRATSVIINEFLKEEEIPEELIPELDQIISDNVIVNNIDVFQSVEYLKRLHILDFNGNDLMLNPIVRKVFSAS